jgi:hypothetical protein
LTPGRQQGFEDRQTLLSNGNGRAMPEQEPALAVEYKGAELVALLRHDPILTSNSEEFGIFRLAF